MGFLDWIVRKQVALGQRRLDRTVASLPDAQLLSMLDRSQFDGVVRIDPSRAPAVETFLARVAAREFAALAGELAAGTLDPASWFYAPGWNGPRPFDYRRHYAAICNELARRGL